MERILITVLFISLAAQSGAQQYAKGNISMGFCVNMNSTRLIKDSVKYGRALLPGIGADFYSSLSPNLYINYGAQFSMKGTNDFDTLGNLRTYYLEPHLALQYSPVNLLRLEAGVQYSRLIMAQTVKLSGESATGKKRDPASGFASPMEYFAGLQIDLGNNSFFGIRYYIPHQSTEFRRLEFRLTVLMVEGYRKRD